MPGLTQHRVPIGTERRAVMTTRTTASELIVAQWAGGQLTPAIASAADVSVTLRRTEITELLEALVNIVSR